MYFFHNISNVTAYVSANKSASTSINVVRVSNNDNIGAANKDNELNIGVDNAEINSTIMPEVHFTLESYYSPEESRTIAANIMSKLN